MNTDAPLISGNRNPAWIWAFVGIALAGLPLTAVVVFTSFGAGDEPLTIARETTYATGPLKSDGKQVDYFIAWEQATYRQGIASDANGYRMIVTHLGISPKYTNVESAEFCQKLGLDATEIADDMTLEEPYNFLERYVKSKDFDPAAIGVEVQMVQSGHSDEYKTGDSLESQYVDEATGALSERFSRPWTLDDLPMMDAWLAANSPALDVIVEAVRKPLFHIPQVRKSANDSLGDVNWTAVPETRSYGRALKARAFYRIGIGDIDGAIDDIVACGQLGRHVSKNGAIRDMLVGLAIEGMAIDVGIAASPEHPPTIQQLQRLRDELNNLPPRGEFGDVLLHARLGSLDVIQSLAYRHKTLADVPFEFQTQPHVDLESVIAGGVDWNAVARKINVNFDRFAVSDNVQTPTLPGATIISRTERSQYLADSHWAAISPAMKSTRDAIRRLRCSYQMHQITLAMLAYERDHGSLPPAFTADSNGDPLHSWRVLLLPYLGQQELFDKIRLNERWDSQYNRQFHGEAVAFCQCPSAELLQGQTTYAVVVGPEMPFEGGERKSLVGFGPESSSMILVVERMQPGCWMDPTQDIPQEIADTGVNNSNGPPNGIGSHHDHVVVCGFSNGSVHSLSNAIYIETLRGLLRGLLREDL
jgi:hypothetical protein